MNKDNAKEYLPLVQAMADGKIIQLDLGNQDAPYWRDVTDHSFGHEPHRYRVKPEPPKPREWEAWILPNDHFYRAYKGDETPAGHKLIRVREIIEESNQ